MLLFILILGTVSAIEVVEIEGDAFYQSDEIDKTNMQLIQRIASLENKIDNLTTKGDLKEVTIFLYDELSKKFRNKTDFLILTDVMINLFTIGLAFGIYFILFRFIF